MMMIDTIEKLGWEAELVLTCVDICSVQVFQSADVRGVDGQRRAFD